jgi:hypothetical protein
MSVSSPCEVCSRADVEAACDRCGKLVCSRHYDEQVGLCTECAAEVTNGEGGHVPDPDETPDGVDTYRF